MALDLLEELKQLVAALRAAQVDHALVGALAVAIHGAPRATSDIDLLIEGPSLPRAIEIARACGFTWLAHPMRFRDGTELQRISKIAGAETLTLDLMLVNEALAHAWSTRVDLTTDFGPLTVVTREALIAMKIAAGRPRDLGDVASLEEMDR
jgi:hypothetical protein